MKFSHQVLQRAKVTFESTEFLCIAINVTGFLLMINVALMMKSQTFRWSLTKRLLPDH